MSRKRRMFDVELPDEIEVAPVPAKVLGRRGPMASAIVENAEALQARASAADAIRAENDALAHEFVALREAGHVVRFVPVDEVQTRLLVRDRMPGEDEELVDLVASIRDLGLSNPIRVLPRPEGDGYELVQGFRRLTAYRQLHDETGDETWAAIPALVLPDADGIDGLYRRMVDENVIRKDLSFAEMAHAARNFAADPATSATDLTEAVAALFQSAPYSKRSYIRSFAALLDAFEDVFRYPTEIPRALGVTLARHLGSDPSVLDSVRQALNSAPDRDAAQEMDILRRFIDVHPVSDSGNVQSSPARKGRSRTKTTFHITSSAGQVKCTAAQGRLEIKVDRDFSAIERARLERAIADLIDGLG